MAGFMTHVTCRLTAKNRDQLRNLTLGNRVCATLTRFLPFTLLCGGNCTQARKATHGLDEQHQDVDRSLRGRVNQNERGQG